MPSKPKPVSSNTAPAALKKKPRGKPFEAGADDRRHRDGQVSKTVLTFNRTMKEIIASVGNEPLQVRDGQTVTRIEAAVRGMYAAATKGNHQAFSVLVERVEGTVKQQMDVTTNGQPLNVSQTILVVAGTEIAQWQQQQRNRIRQLNTRTPTGKPSS